MRAEEKVEQLERWRLKGGQRYVRGRIPVEIASEQADGWNGHFLVPLEGEQWHVILSDGGGWRHLSVTNVQKKVLPDWGVMCRLKELFFGDEATVVQYHPAKGENINDHPWCLHLWEPLEEKLPIPHWVFV